MDVANGIDITTAGIDRSATTITLTPIRSTTPLTLN